MFGWTPKVRFSDSPDGVAPFDKLFSAMKAPIVVGTFIGCVAASAEVQEANSFRALGVIIKRIYPIAGACLFYTSGTFIAAHLRKRDGPLNHAIGVIAAAPFVRAISSLQTTIYVVPLALLLLCGAKNAADSRTKPVTYIEDFLAETPRETYYLNWYLWKKDKMNFDYIKSSP